MSQHFIIERNSSHQNHSPSYQIHHHTCSLLFTASACRSHKASSQQYASCFDLTALPRLYPNQRRNAATPQTKFRVSVLSFSSQSISTKATLCACLHLHFKNTTATIDVFTLALNHSQDLSIFFARRFAHKNAHTARIRRTGRFHYCRRYSVSAIIRVSQEYWRSIMYQHDDAACSFSPRSSSFITKIDTKT